MENTYQWTFSPLETKLQDNGLTDVIKTVHWQFTGTYGANTSITSRLIGLETLAEPSAEKFIEFNNITHENVRTWVLNSMVDGTGMTIEEKEQEMKDTVDVNIQHQINPPIVKREAPW